MSELDAALERIAQMKGEPAPAHIYDETGIAHRAIQVRARKRWHEWNGNDPYPMNDENPY